MFFNLVTKDFNTPGFRGFVELGNDVGIDHAASFKRPIEIDLADFAAQCRLRQLRDRKHVVGNAVRRALRIKHLQIQHAVYGHLYIVARNACLLSNVGGQFFQTVLVPNALHNRNHDVKSRMQCAAVLTEALNDIGTLLRHYSCRLKQGDYYHHD